MPFDAPTQAPKTIAAIVSVKRADYLARHDGWAIRAPIRLEVDSRTIEKRFASCIHLSAWLDTFASAKIPAWTE